MEINLRLIPPCRLHESAPRNPCTLVATFFSVENKRLPSWISATKPTPRPPSLDRSLETTSTFQRSMSHKRQPQHGTLPSSMFKFTSQCLESNRNGPFDFGGSSRICVLFGRIKEELIDLEVIFSWKDNYIWICIWKICTWRTLYERYMFYFWEILIIDRVIM